jgi:hypothetical protein
MKSQSRKRIKIMKSRKRSNNKRIKRIKSIKRRSTRKVKRQYHKKNDGGFFGSFFGSPEEPPKEMTEDEFINQWSIREDNIFRKKFTKEQYKLYQTIFNDLLVENKISKAKKEEKEIRRTQIGYLQAIYHWCNITNNYLLFEMDNDKIKEFIKKKYCDFILKKYKG